MSIHDYSWNFHENSREYDHTNLYKAQAMGKAMKVAVKSKAKAKAKPLTKKNLDHHDKEHKGAKVDEKVQLLMSSANTTIEDVLQKLEPQEQSLLWKNFEKSRKAAGPEEIKEYDSACKGPGKRANSRALLFAWLKGGKSLKSS